MATFIAIKAQSRIIESTRLNARQMAQALTALVGARADDLGGDAQSGWPRGPTGLSAAGIEWGVETITGDSAVAFVQDLVWYAGYVRIPAGNAWAQLLVLPATAEEDLGELSAEIDEMLAALMEPV